MPGNDHSTSRPAHSEDSEQRHLSRRSMLGAAGVGAAGLAVGAFGMQGAKAAVKPAAKPVPAKKVKPRKTKPVVTETQDSSDHIVVHLQAGPSGNIDVYRGTNHIQLNDPELAARLRRSSL